MKARLLGIAVLFLSFLVQGAAFAALQEGKKVALVIGNGNYQHAMALPNPVGDGKLIAETLRKSGFTVIEGSDLTKVDMGRLLDQFTEAAYDADIALFYYAGHGLQVDGHNYLIPVDAELEKAAQLQTRTIPIDEVMNALPPDPAVGVVILDACRDNPLARTLAAAMPKSRSMGAGLAAVQANGLSHDAGGVLIAYATDPGSVAYDGSGEHSPYTTALARNLATPGLEIQSALTRVRAEVSQATNGAQRPWHNASLAREVFIGGQPAPEPVAPPPAAAAEPAPQMSAAANVGEVDWTVERTVWEEASKRNTVAYYEFYLAQYPHGRFANLAQLSIDEIQKGSGPARSAETPSAAPTETAAAAPVVTPPAPTPTQTASAAPVPAPSAAPTPSAAPAQTPSAAPAQIPSPAPTPTPSAAPTQTASAAPDDKPAGAPDDIKLVPGTPATEALLKLDNDARIDIQLRLSALDFYNGDFDGSLGSGSRNAIGAWQQENGMIESTYLTPAQHMLLVTQSDRVVGPVREQYEKQKAAWMEQQTKLQKAAPAPRPPKPATNTASKPAKKSKVASGAPAPAPKAKAPAKSKYCTVYDVVSQSMEPCH